MDKNDRILLTGATGFAGSYIARQLVQEGYTNLRCIRRESSSMALVGKAANEIEWHTADLRNFNEMQNAVEGCRAVIHAAALVAFHGGAKKELFEINARSTASLVNLALEAGVERFVYISSISTLGRYRDRNRIDEDSHFRFGPLDTTYAVSKYMGEMEVWRGGAEGLHTVKLNPSLIIGSGFWNSGTCRMFKRIYNGMKYYPSGCSAYVDVRDVARMTSLLLGSSEVNERFICAERTAPHKEVMDMVADALEASRPGIRLNKTLIELAWRLEWLKGKLGGYHPVITKESLRASAHCFEMDNSKSREKLEFEYTPVEKTIEETAAQFLEAAQENFSPKFLPLH